LSPANFSSRYAAFVGGSSRDGRKDRSGNGKELGAALRNINRKVDPDEGH
jgi:hypothetical protein